MSITSDKVAPTQDVKRRAPTMRVHGNDLTGFHACLEHADPFILQRKPVVRRCGGKGIVVSDRHATDYAADGPSLPAGGPAEGRALHPATLGATAAGRSSIIGNGCSAS